MAIANQWFIARGKTKAGPYSDQQLKQLAQTGQLQPTDMIQRTGMTKWVQAKQIRELFDPQKAKPQPPATPFPAGSETNQNPSVRFSCPKCRTSIQVPVGQAGQKTQCPTCRQRLQVPQPPPPSDMTLLGDLGSSTDRTMMGDLSNLPLQLPTSPDPAIPMSGVGNSGIGVQFPQPYVPTAPLVPSTAPPATMACPHCGNYIPHVKNLVGEMAACIYCRSQFMMPALPAMPQPAPAQAGAQEEPPPTYRRRNQSSAQRVWIAAGITVAVIGGLIVAALYFAGEGPFAPKPQDLILGKWYGREKGNDLYFTFYKDGACDMVVANEAAPCHYRFIDDKTIEITAPADPKGFRCEIRSLTKEELTLRSRYADTVTFKRMK
jgi:hypothetical protein